MRQQQAQVGIGFGMTGENQFAPAFYAPILHHAKVVVNLAVFLAGRRAQEHARSIPSTFNPRKGQGLHYTQSENPLPITATTYVHEPAQKPQNPGRVGEAGLAGNHRDIGGYRCTE
jgi:hypothetical protein